MSTNHTNRRHEMNLMHEDLARAQMAARLGEAHEGRRAQQLARAARAARLTRKAEVAALRARLAAARLL